MIQGNKHTGTISFDPKDVDILYMASFISSLLSAAKGIASFLMDGPCILLSKEGPFGGMGKMGFIFLYINILITMMAKGLLIYFGYSDPNNLKLESPKPAINWIFSSILFPHLLLVSSTNLLPIIIIKYYIFGFSYAKNIEDLETFH